ncbi:tyrosine-protein phosphatase [Pedobacter deserti]|uniref:tyrosine-protein phosphatase n=1 Tax=Pedobacter deserti TaxID=2817382 RepID=UPI002108B484|nr:CpsB/CapC family capsule biosynthesis tyrosine phosphatase [Pedobacter sp. SYSU D00382]
MFSFFKKKTRVDNIEWLGVDVHSHLLPGIDDGSPDVVQSVALIKQLNELGFHKFLCTPHIFKELYPNTCDTINPALAKTREALAKAKINVELGAAAEYMIDENFEVNDDLMCLPGKYVLIEMSYMNESPNIEDAIFDLQIKGYNIILAHPERYIFYHKNLTRLERYKDMGAMLQMNLLAPTGYYGKDVKRAADYLLEGKYYDLAGTDLHHDKHLAVLTNAVRGGYLYEKIGDYPFKNKSMFI